MKRFSINILVLLLTFSIGFLSSCKKKKDPEPPPPTTAELKISIIPMQGEGVDVSLLSVELHSSAVYNNYNIVYSTAASGSSTSSTASFADLPPGTYYLMAWRDKDNDGTYSPLDIFGFHVEALTFTAGMKYNVTLEMYEL